MSLSRHRSTRLSRYSKGKLSKPVHLLWPRLCRLPACPSPPSSARVLALVAKVSCTRGHLTLLICSAKSWRRGHIIRKSRYRCAFQVVSRTITTSRNIRGSQLIRNRSKILVRSIVINSSKPNLRYQTTKTGSRIPSCWLSRHLTAKAWLTVASSYPIYLRASNSRTSRHSHRMDTSLTSTRRSSTPPQMAVRK